MPPTAADTLAAFRPYLEVLARGHLDNDLRGKIDPADIAQEALAKAASAWESLRSHDRPVLLAWLRRILAGTLADAEKWHRRDKRAAGRERLLEADLERSSAGLAAGLAAEQTSPSEAAERNEEMLRLAAALADLAEPLREVVILKHLRGLTLKDIADRLGKTVPAVASYLRRGLEELRHRLADPGDRP